MQKNAFCTLHLIVHFALGLIKGKSEAALNPLDNATRAEAAAIFERFIKAN